MTSLSLPDLRPGALASSARCTTNNVQTEVAASRELDPPRRVARLFVASQHHRQFTGRLPYKACHIRITAGA